MFEDELLMKKGAGESAKESCDKASRGEPCHVLQGVIKTLNLLPGVIKFLNLLHGVIKTLNIVQVAIQTLMLN